MPVAPILVTGELKPAAGYYLDRTHPLAQGLVSYWPLDGDTGLNRDLVRGINLSGSQSVSQAPFGPCVFGTSGSLNATNTALDLAGSFTIAFWVCYLSRNTTLRKTNMFSCGQDFADYDTSFFVRNSDATTDWWYVPNSTPIVGKWQHIVAYYDAVNQVLGAQIDGVDKGTHAHTGGLNNTSGTDFVVGFNGSGQKWAQVGFWSRALLPHERAQLYADPFTMLVSNSLRQYWWLGQAAAGGVSVSPDAVTGTGSTVNPTVILGSLSITPTALTATRGVVDPGVVLGSLVATPSAASALGSVVNPSVIQSSMAIAAAALAASGGVADPTVILSSLALTPSPLAVNGSVVNPGVVQSSMAVSPIAVSATGSTRNPTVLGGTSTTTRHGLGRLPLDILKRFGW
jgi:hypothetical protein